MMNPFCEDLQTLPTDTSNDDEFTMLEVPYLSGNTGVGGESMYPSMISEDDYQAHEVLAQYYQDTRHLPSNLPRSRSMAVPVLTRKQATPTMPGSYIHGTHELRDRIHAVDANNKRRSPWYSFPQGHPGHALPTNPLHVPTPLDTTWSINRDRYYQGEPSQVQRALLSKVQEPPPSRNIVVFGETGTGKSSLINMLADDQIAPTSNRAVGCTFQSTQYPIAIDGTQYLVWDTIGLNEGEAGSVPPEAALDHLVNLVTGLGDGLSLLVYCIRGARYRNILETNYNLFTRIICQGKVPVVIVVTGLENEERMENWWDVNEREFTSRNMYFAGHACVTTTKGKRNMFEQEYEESREVLRALIRNQCPKDAWAVQDPGAWLRHITTGIQAYYDNHNGHSGPANAIKGRTNLHPLSSLVNYILSVFCMFK